MGHSEAAELLQQTLEEEKAADEKLSALAEGGINEAAAEIAHPDADANADPEAGKQASRAARPTATPAKRMAAGRSKSR